MSYHEVLYCCPQLNCGFFSNVERHDLTETTRAMAKRGSEDLKKLSELQSSLVRPWTQQLSPPSDSFTLLSHIKKPLYRRLLMTSRCPWSRSNEHNKSVRRGKERLCKELNSPLTTNNTILRQSLSCTLRVNAESCSCAETPTNLNRPRKNSVRPRYCRPSFPLMNWRTKSH